MAFASLSLESFLFCFFELNQEAHHERAYFATNATSAGPERGSWSAHSAAGAGAGSSGRSPAPTGDPDASAAFFAPADATTRPLAAPADDEWMRKPFTTENTERTKKRRIDPFSLFRSFRVFRGERGITDAMV
jgi:hypothetical protein